MLKYVKKIKGTTYIGFMDENSPKEWEPLIKDKLLEYTELVNIDSIVKNNNIMIILELNPPNNDLNNSEYIKKERKLFEEYYQRIIEDIENPEFYDLYLK
jgi:hypothetical protein